MPSIVWRLIPGFFAIRKPLHCLYSLSLGFDKSSPFHGRNLHQHSLLLTGPLVRSLNRSKSVLKDFMDNIKHPFIRNIFWFLKTPLKPPNFFYLPLTILPHFSTFYLFTWKPSQNKKVLKYSSFKTKLYSPFYMIMIMWWTH